MQTIVRPTSWQILWGALDHSRARCHGMQHLLVWCLELGKVLCDALLVTCVEEKGPHRPAWGKCISMLSGPALPAQVQELALVLAGMSGGLASAALVEELCEKQFEVLHCLLVGVVCVGVLVKAAVVWQILRVTDVLLEDRAAPLPQTMLVLLVAQVAHLLVECVVASSVCG